MLIFSFLFRVSNDWNFERNVGGVLLESGTEIQNELKGRCSYSIIISFDIALMNEGLR